MRPEVGCYVKALYDFEGEHNRGELSLRAGDIVRITDHVDSSWLQGEAIYGAKGCFPANFVEALVLPDARMGQRVFVALSDFTSQQPGDLELMKGDIILGTEQVDDSWWRGKSGPLRGIFPLCCVQEMQTVTEGPRSRSASLKCRSGSLKARTDSLAQTQEEMFARALVDVVPQIEGELGFQTGDLITVQEVVDDDWFYGQCHNRVGLVSTICVEFLVDESQAELGNSHWGQTSTAGHGNSLNSVKGSRQMDVYQGDLSSHTRSYQNCVSYTSENTRSHDAEITPYAKTLYPFQAQLPTELSFGDNEIIRLVQHVDEDWIEGELDGKIGLFPATFVEIIVDCPTQASAVQSPGDLKTASGEDSDCGPCSVEPKAGSTEHPGAPHRQNTHLSLHNGIVEKPASSESVGTTGLALVLHDFSGEMEGDLQVKEGDTIDVLRVVDSDWLEARHEGGLVGLVPQNHVQVIAAAPVSITVAASRCSAHSASGSITEDMSVQAVPTSSTEDGEEGEEHLSDCQGDSAASVSPLEASESESARMAIKQTNHHLLSLAVASCQPSASKPAPLKPKPKLAPKPALKVKPSLVPRSAGPRPASYAEGVQARPASQQHALRESATDRHHLSTDRSRRVFSSIEGSLSLDSLVRAELEKAKSEGEQSQGSSVIGDDKQSRSGSFSSTVSEDQQVNTADTGHVGSESSHRAQDIAHVENTTQIVLDKRDSEDNCVTDSQRTEHTPFSGCDLKPRIAPPSTHSRGLNDSGPQPGSQGSKVTSAPEASVTSRINQGPSPTPSRPAPVMPRPVGRGLLNAGFENDHEGQLVSLTMTSTPPPLPSSCPMPQGPRVQQIDKEQDLLMMLDGERSVKRPPPRPTGPRIASVPSRTPLQPVKVEASKPVPHRPAPAVPGTRRSAPMAPFSTPTLPQDPMPPASIPPRPSNLTMTPPPKRPPPRLQKSPQDLMRFSPEPVGDAGEASEDLVTDLKNRLQENRTDIQKYEQTRQELQTQLAEADMQEVRRQEVKDRLQFVIETLNGLREEENRLQANLFSVSPREEKLEKARLLAQQRAADERQRRQEEEKSAAEERSKRKEKRQKVLQELLDTEKDYLFDLQLCLTVFFDDNSPIRVPSCVDMECLFGNMEEIADVAQRLLTSLESAICGKAFSDQIVGSTFVALAEDMKNTYAPYCRHHDDVIAIMEKYREVPEAMQFFAAKVEEMRRRTNIFDVEAMLIKPVQRILKYPLLLHELMKSTENDHPDKAAINNAIRAMTDVATAINEYKRRKDLVYKYKRDSDQSFAMKIAKLNFHSIKKKSSRMRGRLSTNLGIGLQLRDENFEQVETKFRSAEKAVKILLRNVMTYMDHLQEVITCQENLAADISDYFGEKACEEVSRYLTVHRELLSHYKTVTTTVEELVLSPLNRLVAMFNGPNNVIDKRFDKLLDYNNLLGRGKDEKLVEAAQKDYEAMNAQLLDELPRLYTHTLTLLQLCMAAYVRTQRDFQDHALKENCILLELPSVLGASENVMDTFNIRHTSALDQISLLSFIPRGFNPKMDAFRRGSTRQSCDPAKPPPIIQCSSQSDSQRAYLRQMYGSENLYHVMQTMAAQDLMDMAVTEGMLVAVIKDKDPMGGRQRWFVDDGANKGFVQSSILAKSSLSHADSASSLSTLVSEEGVDTQDLAAFSTSLDEGDALPWMSGSQTAESSLLPPVTPMAPQPPDSKATTTAQPHLEKYCAEYPFTSRGSNEVSVAAGQTVVVLCRHDLDGNTEWWLVDVDGYQGYVPANYLRKI